MGNTEDIKKIAKQVLTSSAFDGRSDGWLWDTAQRIERNVDAICRSLELEQANMAIDMFCLKGAAYFFFAGETVASVQNGSTKASTASALVAAKWLDEVIGRQRTEKISRIIMDVSDKNTRLNEAKILSDAINLDDVGGVGVFNQVRTAVMQKKSVSEVLSSFKKKADYGYWQARLDEGFHFKSTAKTANKRFAIMNTFMQNLEKESTGQI